MPRTLDEIMQAESGGRNVPNATGPGGTPASTASGPWQMINSTYREARALAGLPPGSTRAMDDPVPEQKLAAQALYAKYGDTPWAASAGGGGGRGGGGGSDMADNTTQTDTTPRYTLQDLAGLLGIGRTGSGPSDRPQTFLSRLGEAAGGGGGGLEGADRESAGLRALGSLGMGLLANSGWHSGSAPTFGQAWASGQGLAQGSEAASQNALYEAQQAQAERVKAALGILGQQRGQDLTASGQALTAQAQREAARHNVAGEAVSAGELGARQGELRLKEEAQKLEMRKQWDLAHPGEPFPGDAPAKPATAAPAPPPPPGAPGSGGPAASPATMPAPAIPPRADAAPPPDQATTDVATIQGGTGQPPAPGVQVAGPGAPTDGGTAPADTTTPPKGPATAGGIPLDFAEWNATLPPVPMRADIQKQLDTADKLTPAQQARYDQGKRLAVAGGDSAAQAAKLIEVENKRAEDIASNQKQAQDAANAFNKDMLDKRAAVHQARITAEEQRVTQGAADEMQRYQKNYAAPFDAIQPMRTTLDMMDAHSRGAAATPGGAGGAFNALVNQGMKALPAFIRPNMSETEVYGALSQQLALQLKAANPIGGSTSDRDLDFLIAQAPTLSTTPEGRIKLSAALRQVWDHQGQIYQAATQEIHGANHNLSGLQARLDTLPAAIPQAPPVGSKPSAINDWIKTNKMQRGKLYYDQNGNMIEWAGGNYK